MNFASFPADIQREVFFYLKDYEIVKIYNNFKSFSTINNNPNDIFWKRKTLQLLCLPEDASFEYIFERLYYKNLIGEWTIDTIDNLLKDKNFLSRHMTMKDMRGMTMMSFVFGNHPVKDNESRVEKILSNLKDVNLGRYLFGVMYYHSTDILKMFIDNGADVNYVDTGLTALTGAVCYNQLGAIKILLENGANIHQKDGLGYTALSLAKEKGFTHIVELLQSY
jgi:ankyrin repeat protein